MSWARMQAPEGSGKVLARPPEGQRYAHCYDTEAGDRIRRERPLRAWKLAVVSARLVHIDYVQEDE